MATEREPVRFTRMRFAYDLLAYDLPAGVTTYGHKTYLNYDFEAVLSEANIR